MSRAAGSLPRFTSLVLRWELDNQVLVVTLNRPEKLNALDEHIMSELRTLWGALDRIPGIRCVVITGAGNGFCAGADASLLQSDRSSAPVTSREELSFLPRHQITVPVIVAVNGTCAGGGLHLVADGDIVIAGEHASFLDPHVSVGQVSALEPVSLSLKVRFDILTRMVLLGRAERLDAEAARQAGLVSEVVADDDLLSRAVELAGMVAANAPSAVRRSRSVLIDLEETLLRTVLDRGWDAVRAQWTHPDAAEGPAAFVARRPPVWSPDEPDTAG